MLYHWEVSCYVPNTLIMVIYLYTDDLKKWNYI